VYVALLTYTQNVEKTRSNYHTVTAETLVTAK